MTNKILVKSYIKIHDHEYIGFRQEILLGLKKVLSNVLQKGLEKEGISDIDIMFPSEIADTEKMLDEMNDTSIVDFLKFGNKSQKRMLAGIIRYFENKDAEKYKIIIEQGGNIINQIDKNIYDEMTLYTFFNEAKQLTKAIIKHNEQVKSSLYKLSRSQDISDVLMQERDQLKQVASNLKDLIKIDPIKTETYTIIKENASFVSKLSKDAHESIALFLNHLHNGDYKNAYRLFNIRSSTLKQSGLSWVYTSLKEYMTLLKEDGISKHHKDILTSIIQDSVKDVDQHLDVYIETSLSSIALEQIHKSLIGNFHDIRRIIEGLLVFMHLPENHPLRKHLDILQSAGVIEGDSVQFIKNHKNTISMEDIQAFAKDLFNQLEELSTHMKSIDKQNSILQQQRLQSRNRFVKMWDTAVFKIEDFLSSILQKSKGIPRLILLSLIIIASVVFLPLIKLIKYLISGGENQSTGSVGGEGGLGNDGGDGGNEAKGLLDSETIRRFFSELSTAGIGDLINRAFTGDLFSGTDKRNNLNNERDLLSNEADVLKNIDIINYHALDSGLLVGEVFMQLQNTRWKKEKIDHSNKHVLECFHDGVFSENYDFFTSREGWEIRESGDDRDSPGIVLQPAALIKGKNSIVCPRGYIPVLSQDSRNMLKDKKITYELYCIKNLGYYYLVLDESIPVELVVHYKRYGDTSYNGIFFNTQENQPVGGYANIQSILQEDILETDKLPKHISEVVYDQKFTDDSETIVKNYTDYLWSNFEYSTTKEYTTQEYVKYPSYLLGVANTKVGDCKNINTLNIGLIRSHDIQAQMCAGYVQADEESGFSGHGITEVNIDGKCLLVDATPGTEFVGMEDEDKEDPLDALKEKFGDLLDSASELKANITEFFSQYLDAYKKWNEKRKKKLEENRNKQLKIDELAVERKRNEILRIIGNLEVDLSTIFVQYIQNLPNSAILKSNLPKDQYIEYIGKYLGRLDKLACFVITITRFWHINLFRSIKKDLIEGLTQNIEKWRVFNGNLVALNNIVGGEKSRDEILSDIVQCNGDLGSIVNKNPKYGINQAYDSAYVTLISQLIDDPIEEYFLPKDISVYIEKYNEPLTSGGYVDQIEKELIEGIEGEQKDKYLAPQKAKTLLLSHFKFLCDSFIDHIDRKTKKLSLETSSRLKLFVQNCIDMCDTIDEGFWLQWDKKALEEIVSYMDFKKSGENSLNELIFKVPLNHQKNTITNQHLNSRKPFYQIRILFDIFCKGSLFTDNGSSTKTHITIYEEVFGEKDGFSKIVSMLSKSTYENENIIHTITETQYDEREVESAVWSIMQNLHVDVYANIKLSQQEKNDLQSLYKGRLLEKYENNHLALIDIITNQKRMFSVDMKTLLNSIRVLGEQNTLSSKEGIIIEKAIRFIVEKIIEDGGPSTHSNGRGLQSPSTEDLSEALESIHSEHLLIIIDNLHSYYSQKTKLFKKNILTGLNAQSFRNSIYDMIDVFDACLHSIQKYTLKNKSSLGANILNYKIRLLIRSLHRISLRPQVEDVVGDM